MSPRLVGPEEAARQIVGQLARTWSQRVCAESSGASGLSPIRCGLRPGVGSSGDVERIGFTEWEAWRSSWRAVDLDGVAGVVRRDGEIRVRRVAERAPHRLEADSAIAAVAFLERVGAASLSIDIERAMRLAARLTDVGARVTPASLRAAYRLTDEDVEVAAGVVAWLRDHPELGEWTTRQLPVPGMHTKWLSNHGGLVRELAGRDVGAETRPRPSIVHFTYVDPAYLATGGRRHDAWTTGDSHQPAYQPRIVLVVENRDCRLSFPDLADTIVVEGQGNAAASAMSTIPWLFAADHIVYWGDMDCDGFGILDHVRREMRTRGRHVDSILMDGSAWTRYGRLGVDRGKDGALLTPSGESLGTLTEAEAAAYAMAATAGDVPFRRIEQERIPTMDALRALELVVGRRP